MEFHEREQVCYPKAEHSAQHGPGSMFILTCSCPGMRSSNYTYSEYKAYQIQNKVLHKRNHHTPFTLQEGMATHSSTLAWRIPWTEEPGAGYSPQGRKESGVTEVTERTCPYPIL